MNQQNCLWGFEEYVEGLIKAGDQNLSEQLIIENENIEPNWLFMDVKSEEDLNALINQCLRGEVPSCNEQYGNEQLSKSESKERNDTEYRSTYQGINLNANDVSHNENNLMTSSSSIQSTKHFSSGGTIHNGIQNTKHFSSGGTIHNAYSCNKNTIEVFDIDEVEDKLKTNPQPLPSPQHHSRKLPLHPQLIDMNQSNQISNHMPSNSISSLSSCHPYSVNNPKWFDSSFPWDDLINKVNLEVFGNDGFREQQRNVINAALSNEDVFLMMPTGGGKSLCFQLPAMISSNHGVSVVIMPLLSLMQDQHDQLISIGIECRMITGTSTIDEIRQTYNDLRRGAIHLLFITPEKLSGSTSLMNLLKQLNDNNQLSRFVIDEAHCVSQWGNDFRGDYLKLKNLRKDFPNVPLMCLTATATDAILIDVIEQLLMRDTQVFKRSFDRPNLRYEVRPKNKKTLVNDILQFIKFKYPNSSGIIYCLSRAECEKLAAELTANGIPSAYYHSSADDKESVQRRWMNDEIQVMVATVAFGMGINKRDVRFVIHSSMPKSIENYHQESGRAGRDGIEATCILYYEYHDKIRIQNLNSPFYQKDGNRTQSIRSSSTQSIIEKNILTITGYCENVKKCRRQIILEHFGEVFTGKCKKECDNCRRRRKYPLSLSVKPCVIEVDWVVALVKEAKAISKSAKALTIAILRDILLGRKNTSRAQYAINFNELVQFGCLRNVGWSSEEVSVLLHQMVIYQILEENVVQFNSQAGGYMGCISFGPLGDKHRVAGLTEITTIKEFRSPKTITGIPDYPGKKIGSQTYRGISSGRDLGIEEPNQTGIWDKRDLVPGFDSQRSKRGNVGTKPNKTNKATRLDNYSRPATARAFHSRMESDTDESMKSVTVNELHPIESEDETDEKRDFIQIEDKLKLNEEGMKQLEQRLKELRKEIAEDKKMKGVTHVISAEGIKQLVKRLPITLGELKAAKIPSLILKRKIQEYGERFVTAIVEFISHNHQYLEDQQIDFSDFIDIEDD